MQKNVWRLGLRPGPPWRVCTGFFSAETSAFDLKLLSQSKPVVNVQSKRWETARSGLPPPSVVASLFLALQQSEVRNTNALSHKLEAGTAFPYELLQLKPLLET